MVLSLSSLIVGGKLAWASFKSSLPLLRRAKAERRAGVSPRSVPKSSTDALLDSALKILGAVSNDESLWEQLIIAFKAGIVRPERFSRPHVQEWLSRSDVQSSLKSLIKSQLSSAPESLADRDVLLSAYMEVSGENKSSAENYILVAVNFLNASIQESVKDPGVAAIVQAGFSRLQVIESNIEKKIDGIVEDYALFASGAVSEHHGEDAKSRLDEILKRRASPGSNSLAELRELASSLEREGKFAAAPIIVKERIYDWLARLAAGSTCLSEAEDALSKIENLGRSASVVTLSWVEVARGHVDAALRMLNAEDSADSRSSIFSILHNYKSPDAALKYLDAHDEIYPDLFTSMGWKNVIGFIAEKGSIDRAKNILSSLPEGMFIESPALGYIRGVVYAASLVSDEWQERMINEDYLATCDHLLEGDDADSWRHKVRSSFEVSLKASEEAGDKSLAERSLGWLRWLNLIDPALRDKELVALSAEMEDGNAAVDLMPLAYAFGVKFDSSALSKRLEKSEMLGGLASKELNAKVLLLNHSGHFSELAAFIEDNWGRLVEIESPAALGGTLIQAYVRAGECGRAEETLEANLADLYPLDVPRYRLMIGHCRGDDPTLQARENYEDSKTTLDLANFIFSLEKERRWSELVPYSLEMFNRERNAGNALRYVKCLSSTNALDEDVLRFLDLWPDLVNREPELMSARAWALYHLGRVEEARSINVHLLGLRRNINDLVLDINLSVRMGDWERLPSILEREWARRGELSARLMLHLAQLTSASARERALQIVKECTDREPNDPHLLLQAYSVAAAMGRDDIAMPLVNKAARLSAGQEGPIWSLSAREMVEMLKESADDWRKKNQLFRSGNIPIHWAAKIFNIPLCRLLIAIPRENKAQADARRRQPIPIRAGNRQPIETSSVNRLALDITSAFILNGLGYLGRLIDTLDETLLSPRFMEVLLFEEEKVRFHQPSRIEAAKPLLELRQQGRLALVETAGPPQLVEEVGEEEAALLAAARSSGGLCIHTGKLYRVSSFLEEEARLGDFADSLASPAVVARALYEEGLITASCRDKFLEYLMKVSDGDLSGTALAAGDPVFLDRVSAQSLSECELLSILSNSGRQVFVHPSAVDEWQALVETEPHSGAMVDALEDIRRTIKEGMAKGKVQFLREGRGSDRGEKFGISELPMLDLFTDVSLVDAVCIDDRLLNSQHLLEDRKGKKVNLLCSLDMIDMLVERGMATNIERAESIHRMREWCFSALPLSPGELLELLLERSASENSALSESAQLRVIREYLARLHSSDILCAESDLVYMDELWRIGQKTILDLWADEHSAAADIIARADWVVDNIIPDIELAMRFAPQRRERMEDIALARMMTAMLVGMTAPDRLKSDCSEWIERKIVGCYLPACSKLVDKAARWVSTWAIERSVEIENEVESLNGEENDPRDA